MVDVNRRAPRLTGLDSVFLAMEYGHTQMHTLKMAIFESLDGGPPPTDDDIREVLRRRLHAVPCYSQKLRFVPLQLRNEIGGHVALRCQ